MTNLLYSKKDIKKAINKIATKLDRVLPEQLEVIVLMDGAFKFASDLLAYEVFQKRNIRLHFIKTSRKIEKDITKVIVNDYDFTQFEDKTVLILDEIYDTGITIDTIEKLLPKSTKIFIAVLITKKVLRHLIYGIYCDNDNWLYGYGMDLKDKDQRHLNEIYYLDNAELKD